MAQTEPHVHHGGVTVFECAVTVVVRHLCRRTYDANLNQHAVCQQEYGQWGILVQ